jgi:transcriptional regulator with XRE-family HTH domain
MKTEIGNRIISIRKALGDLSQGEFARRLGIKQGVISNIEIGSNGPSESTIKLICLTFNINEIWFRTGEGKMFVQEELTGDDDFDNLPNEEKIFLLEYRRLSESNKKAAQIMVESLLKSQPAPASDLPLEPIRSPAGGDFQEDKCIG